MTNPGVDFSNPGPAVGDAFPDVVLKDQHGSAIDLHKDRGGRPAVVVFHRSARW
jgi:peroxiredoxin